MCLNIVGRRLGSISGFRRGELDLECVDDAARNVVLKREDVGQVAVVTFRPKMRPVRGVDELRRDSDPIASATDRAFQHRPHAEFASNRADIGIFALVSETRAARYYQQSGDFGKIGDDVFAYAVGEIFLFRISRHIVERQHRDRGRL
jgi:hypothetical protein